jgi:hypothetical protein
LRETHLHLLGLGGMSVGDAPPPIDLPKRPRCTVQLVFEVVHLKKKTLKPTHYRQNPLIMTQSVKRAPPNNILSPGGQYLIKN